MPASTLISFPPLPLAQAAMEPAAAQPTHWFFKKAPAKDMAKQMGGRPFLFARDINTAGSKRFAVRAAPLNGELDNANLYELVMPANDVHVAFDFDLKDVTQFPDFDAPAAAARVYVAAEELHATGPLVWQVLDASLDNKFSRHAVATNTRLTLPGLRAFIEVLMARPSLRDLPKGFIDVGVYSDDHCMRMCGQSKFGSARLLVPFNGSSANAIDHLWSYYDDHTAPHTWTDPRPTTVLPVEFDRPNAMLPNGIRQDVIDLMDMLSINTPELNAFRDNYNDWINVGIALYNTGNNIGAPDAFLDDWDTWSEASPKYKEGECAVKWYTFTPGTKGIGSLRHWAKTFNPEGFADFRQRWFDARTAAEEELAAAQDERDDDDDTAFGEEGGAARVDAEAKVAAPPSMEDIPTEVWNWKPSGNESYVEVKERFEKYNFMITQHGLFGRYNFGSRIPTFNNASTLNTIYADWKSKDDGKSNFINKWMVDIEKRRYQTVNFAPPPCVVPAEVFNTFYGFKASFLKCEPAEDMGVILDFIDVLAGREANAHKYLLDWMAACLQQPAKKSDASAILLHGEQGIGKNLLIEFFGKDIIGSNYYKKPRNVAESVFGRFADALENTVLLFIDETKGLQRYDEELKDLITSEEVTIEPKGQKRITLRNAARLIMATNNENVLKVGTTDRRYVLIHSSAEKRTDTAYFTSIRRWMDDERNQRGFFNFLITRDISAVDFINGRPVTTMYKQAKLDSLPTLTKWLIEKAIAADKAEPVALLVAAEERENFRTFARESRDREAAAVSDSAITRQLKKLGVDAGDDIVKINNQRAYQYTWAAVRAKICEVTTLPADALFE